MQCSTCVLDSYEEPTNRRFLRWTAKSSLRKFVDQKQKIAFAGVHRVCTNGDEKQSSPTRWTKSSYHAEEGKEETSSNANERVQSALDTNASTVECVSKVITRNRGWQSIVPMTDVLIPSHVGECVSPSIPC